jgi:hypothetical protein
MHRRQFLLSSTIPLLGSLNRRPSHAFPSPEPQREPVPDIYARLVRATDAAIPQLLSRQELRSGHRGLGGIPDLQGIYTAGAAAGLIKTLSTAYCVPESHYRNSDELVQRMELALSFLLSIQHSDGTIDLHTTNFHSPPDTAFIVEPLAAAMAVVKKVQPAGLDKVKAKLDQFLVSAGKALAAGGIHTPNHRWVVCSALARLHSLYPSKNYETRIDEWLAEGVDIGGDGQFTEGSTSIYSPVCDGAFLTIARLMRRPGLLDPVRRNLTMTLYYMHADGEVATEGSRRQDQYARGSMAAYYIPYRFLALEDRDKKFAAAARLIEERSGDGLAGNLIYFLEEPKLRQELPPGESLPNDYEKFFRSSDLVRIRRGPVSATILGTNPTFFSFHKGSAALQAVRLAAAFFGKGQFQGVRVEADSDRWILRQSLVGPYYQPLPADARRADGDWGRMDNSRRAQSEIQKLEYTVAIREDRGAFEMRLDINGCENVPVSVELAFRRGGELHGVVPLADTPDAYLLEKGAGRYSLAGEIIEFGPGKAEHRYTQLRGALPKQDALSVYLTGFTPYQQRLTIA